MTDGLKQYSRQRRGDEAQYPTFGAPGELWRSGTRDTRTSPCCGENVPTKLQKLRGPVEVCSCEGGCSVDAYSHVFPTIHWQGPIWTTVTEDGWRWSPDGAHNSGTFSCFWKSGALCRREMPGEHHYKNQVDGSPMRSDPDHAEFQRKLQFVTCQVEGERNLTFVLARVRPGDEQDLWVVAVA